MSRRRRRAFGIISPLFLYALKIHTRLTGQQRARMIVRDSSGDILLIWETIGVGRWSIPGGGIKRGEDPVMAAIRELHEETGVTVEPKDCHFVAFLESSVTHIGYDAYLYETTIDRNQLPDRLHNPIEIVETKWFPVDHLPSPLSPLVRAGVERLSKTSKI